MDFLLWRNPSSESRGFIGVHLAMNLLLVFLITRFLLGKDERRFFVQER
jgi:hypothetical protein